MCLLGMTKKGHSEGRFLAPRRNPAESRREGLCKKTRGDLQGPPWGFSETLAVTEEPSHKTAAAQDVSRGDSFRSLRTLSFRLVKQHRSCLAGKEGHYNTKRHVSYDD